MKQILVISGKGGTGKTTFTASLAQLQKKVVVCDCDVDAPDLHMLLNPKKQEKIEFKGQQMAYIDRNLCRNCGKCSMLCQFQAIGKGFVVDPVRCEGCGVCSWNCPCNAITMKERIAGEYYISKIKNGYMVHALLNPGESNSGKLVSAVKKKGREIAEQKGFDKILIDGAPGIACPVIASLSGVDLAVIVTEPTLSGFHDMERVHRLCEHFKLKTNAVVNKFDLNTAETGHIEKYCREKGIEVIGKIPFSEAITEALMKGKTVLESKKSNPVVNILHEINRKVWNSTEEKI